MAARSGRCRNCTRNWIPHEPSPPDHERRAAPARRIGTAEERAHGDLKENAEYHAAREQQGFIEGRIKQLEAELSHAQVIDVSTLNAGTRVVFGATVTLADVETDDEKRYQIVGDLEADIKLGMIAISSPIARALIGKHEGDVVEIDAPAGKREFELIQVAYEG
jgi:transcription elongation factor GreA